MATVQPQQGLYDGVEKSFNLRNPTLVTVFDALQIVGLVGTTLIFGTALVARKTVKRDLTWNSLAFGMVLFSFSYSLLFISGQQNEDTPAFGLCMTQAILIYASSAFVAYATLGVALQLMFRVRASLNNDGDAMPFSAPSYVAALPYVAFTCVLITASIAGGLNPEAVEVENGLHCGIVNGIPGRVTAVLVLIAIPMVVAVTAWIVKYVRRSWTGEKAEERAYYRGLLVRLGIFSVFIFISIVAGSAVLTQDDQKQGSSNIMYPCISILFCLIFGSQRDILEAWAFWRTRPEGYHHQV